MTEFRDSISNFKKLNYLFLHKYIEYYTETIPNSVAIVYGESSLTYLELNQSANKLANLLISKGICPEKTIGIFLEPSLDLIIAVFAVLKAGGVYLPISTTLPNSRIDYILKDSNTTILLTKNEFISNFKSDSLEFIDVNKSYSDFSDSNPDTKINENNAAFIIYTSGSTGKPKGVVLEHRNLTYYINWYVNNIYSESGVDLPLTSSLSFAAAVTQLYSSLVIGRTLNILNPNLLRQPKQLFDWYKLNKGYGLYCVPTLWEELINYAENINNGNQLISPECVFLSGEAVPEQLLDRTYNLFPEIQLWNLYGPTEATANISYGQLRKGEEVHLGKVIEESELFILDKNLKEVKNDEIGEIYISGKGIAREYINLEKLSNEYFFNHKLDNNKTYRLYKTGDLAKYDKNNKIIFLGRADNQVKINGYRIELSEIENVLLRNSGIRQALVLKKHFGRNSQLIAYVVLKKTLNLSINDIRNYLAENLPDYMMPNIIMILDSFPKLKNGKINRKKLPEPGTKRPNLNYPYVSPTNDSERKLIKIWEEILGFEELGINDNFFDIGGNSLKIISAIYRINEIFNVNIPFRYFFKYQTPYELSKFIAKESNSQHFNYQLIKRQSNPTDYYIMNSNQESLWFIMQIIPLKSLYNILFSIEIKGEFDLSYLQESLENIISRHKTLNSVFKVIDNEPFCVIKELRYLSIEFLDLSRFEGIEQKNKIDEIQNNEINFVFDLERGPLYKFKVVKINDNRHILLVLVHHIIFDGWSVNLMTKELFEIYVSHINQDTAKVPELSVQYFDYANWQKENLESPYYSRMLRFWLNKLKDSNFVLDFPSDFLRPKIQSFNGNYIKTSIGKDLNEKIKEFNKHYGLTPFMTFLSVFNLLLFKYTKQDDILVGCPVANRTHKEIENLIGYFVNTIVIRTKLSNDISFEKVLSDTKETTIEALEHQEYPFNKLVKHLKIERVPSISPVFQVMFAYHNAYLKKQEEKNISFSVKEIHNPASKFDLVLELEDLRDNLELRLTYNTDLFKKSTIERLINQYQYLLSSVIDNPSKQLSEYSLINENDILKQYREYNSAKIDFPKNKGIHQLFEEQTIKTPNLSALVFEDTVINYNELNKKANKLANYILSKGVERKSPIGVQMETSEKMLISLLAILKIDCPYIPLDPYYPKERNKYIIENSKVELIISDDNYFDILSEFGIKVLNIDNEATKIEEFSEKNIEIEKFNSEDLAYIIYTSGSTGKPKGVMISHKSVCNYLLWMKKTFPIDENDVVLNRTSINFDISVWELFLPIICGSKLVLAKKEILQAPESLSELINKQKITNIQFVPSSLKIFLDSGLLSTCKSIKRIFSGGEKLSIDLQNKVFSEFDGELINFYGPTEATIYMFYWKCKRGSVLNYVPIGKPVFNSEVYIFDENMKLLSFDSVGELYIGGEVLAKGYLGLPELTEKSFIPHPFDKNKKLYKTGDLVKLSSEGIFEFIGRLDHQVKVRGYRIELEEIEYYLHKHHLIKQAVVITREDKDSDVRIIAYFVPRNGEIPDNNELRNFLKEHLPDYMIPSFFISIDSIPVLANGKINKEALPSIMKQSTKNNMDNSSFSNSIEETIANIWREVLGTDQFNSEDNFYDVGGHSLLMMKVKSLIEKRTKLSVSVVDLFQYPNIQSLAKYFINKYKTKENMNSDIAKRVAMRKKALSPKIKKIIEKYNHDKS